MFKIKLFSSIIYTFLPVISSIICLQKSPVLAQENSTINPRSIEQTINENTQQDSIMRLYGGQRTRTFMIIWYLEELGCPYEYINLNIREGENKKPEYLAINPLGKVPALVDGDFTLLESGAILLYLSYKYNQMPSDLTEQAKITEWILFANPTLGNGLFLEDRREQEMPILLNFVNQSLEDKSFLLGDNFTIADVAVGYYLYMAKLLINPDWSAYPNVLNYLDRLSAREAFQIANQQG